MAANDPQSSPTDFLLELTSPQSCVDTTTKDRMTIQLGRWWWQMICMCVPSLLLGKEVCYCGQTSPLAVST